MENEEFYNAWRYVADHPLLGDFDITMALDVFVTKVNPRTGEIDDNDANNTHIEVWLEFGFPEMNDLMGNLETPQLMRTHDLELDCGADTFEEAIIKLAKLVKEKYPYDSSRS